MMNTQWPQQSWPPNYFEVYRIRQEYILRMRHYDYNLMIGTKEYYKDKPADALRWLETMGDPYSRIGADVEGRVAIDWGVYGAPETFVVDPRGIIVDKEIGPITPEILERKIVPVIAQLRKPLAPSDSGR